MSQAIKKTEGDLNSLVDSLPLKNYQCQRCGGNGYMKTNPNCYHTCLACLGRGAILKSQTSF